MMKQMYSMLIVLVIVPTDASVCILAVRSGKMTTTSSFFLGGRGDTYAERQGLKVVGLESEGKQLQQQIVSRILTVCEACSLTAT